MNYFKSFEDFVNEELLFESKQLKRMHNHLVKNGYEQVSDKEVNLDALRKYIENANAIFEPREFDRDKDEIQWYRNGDSIIGIGGFQKFKTGSGTSGLGHIFWANRNSAKSSNWNFNLPGSFKATIIAIKILVADPTVTDDEITAEIEKRKK